MNSFFDVYHTMLLLVLVKVNVVTIHLLPLQAASYAGRLAPNVIRVVVTTCRPWNHDRSAISVVQYVVMHLQIVWACPDVYNVITTTPEYWMTTTTRCQWQIPWRDESTPARQDTHGRAMTTRRVCDPTSTSTSTTTPIPTMAAPVPARDDSRCRTLGVRFGITLIACLYIKYQDTSDLALVWKQNHLTPPSTSRYWPI